MLRTVLILLLLLARPALAFPALWVVHGPHATVYLLGSVHIVRPGTIWESPAIERAVADAQQMWFEIDLTPAENALMTGTVLLTGIDPGHALSDRLSPEAASQFHALFGDGIDRAEHFRPWLALTVVMAKRWSESGYSSAAGVDATLRQQAVAAGKPVHGIESGSAQIRMLADIPDDEALRALQSFLLEPPQTIGAQMDRLGQLWLDGDTDGVDALMQTMMSDTSPAVAKRLLSDRNVVFADKVAELAAGEQTVLVTVGAGHMAGDEGVPALLQKRGLAVERVR